MLVEIILISITPTLLIQDQSGGTQSNTVLSKGNPNLVDVGVSCVKGGQLKEQFPSGNDFSLKVLHVLYICFSLEIQGHSYSYMLFSPSIGEKTIHNYEAKREMDRRRA